MILLDIIKEIEYLLWAIILVIALFVILKYYCMPKRQLKHERQMKADAHDREMDWYFIKKPERPLETEKELKKCKEKLEELQKKEKELNNGTESLKQEREQFEKEVLKTKIKTYEDIIKTLNK